MSPLYDQPSRLSRLWWGLRHRASWSLSWLACRLDGKCTIGAIRGHGFRLGAGRTSEGPLRIRCLRCRRPRMYSEQFVEEYERTLGVGHEDSSPWKPDETDEAKRRRFDWHL